MKNGNRIYTNELIQKIIYVYTMILLLITIIACYMAYSKEHAAMTRQMEQTMKDLEYVYKSNTEHFWRMFAPIYSTNGEDIKNALQKYFGAEDKTALNLVDYKNLSEALQTLMAYNHSVRWIGLYAGNDNDYLLFEGDTVLTDMKADFPFIEDMEKKGPAMEVYGSKLINREGKQHRYYAICGGTSAVFHGGKFIFGFDTNQFEEAYVSGERLENIRFCVLSEHGIVFDSYGIYDQERILNIGGSVGVCRQEPLMYVHKLKGTGSDYSIFCAISWWDMVRECHSYTPFIIAGVMIFWVCSIVIYRWSGSVIVRKIQEIQHGLQKIGENRLDYRIQVPTVPTDEFESIGQSINKMTVRLQKNMSKTYELRLKQREAMLSELQSKFNPHFLYNTLEVIRSRVYENGDIETSDIIINLAQIFRNLIGSEHFVSIREEIDFCNLYLTLLRYRYEDKITILYEIDSGIMKYGIIRNLIQPVLENFFVHGFKAESQRNVLKITGKISDEKHILFCVWDNGLGISEEKLAELKENLNNVSCSEQISSNSSYGLKNIHRRIKLFYGADCGVEIKSNEVGGTMVEVKIKRLTYEEHETKLLELEEIEE